MSEPSEQFYTDHEMEAATVVTWFFTSLSILGGLSLLWCYIYVKRLRQTPAFGLVLHLVFSDLMCAFNGAVYNLNSIEANETVCFYWGLLRQYFVFGNILWPFVFVSAIYKFFNKSFENILQFKLWLTWQKYFCWIIPAFVALIPIIVDQSYGATGLFCWIDNPNLTIDGWLGMICFFVPLLVLNVLMIGMLIHMRLAVKKSGDQATLRALDDFSLYPISSVIINVLCYSDKYMNIEADSKTNVTYVLIHLALRQSQGFVHAMIYRFSSKVQEAVKSRKDDEKQQVNASLNESSDQENLENYLKNKEKERAVEMEKREARPPTNPLMKREGSSKKIKSSMSRH